MVGKISVLERGPKPPVMRTTVFPVTVGASEVVVVVGVDGRRIAAKLDLAVLRLRSESWRLQALVKLKYTSTSAV